METLTEKPNEQKLDQGGDKTPRRATKKPRRKARRAHKPRRPYTRRARPEPDDSPKGALGDDTRETPQEIIVALDRFDPPSITHQTRWECGFYHFYDQSETRLYFNPSIVDWNGVHWLATRCVTPRSAEGGMHWRNCQSRIVLWPLANNAPTSDRVEIRLPAIHSQHNFEDPRCVTLGNSMLLSYCSFVRGWEIASQEFSVVSPRFIASRPVRLAFGNNKINLRAQRGHEKNWAPFTHGGRLCFVYQPNPSHAVLEVAGRSVMALHETEIKCPEWNFGAPRGGCPPLRIGDEYWTIFHSSRRDGGRIRYFMGAYAFEAKPPFTVTRRTRTPLLTASHHDPLGDERKAVVFPAGAVRHGDTLHVALGVNDCRCAWIRLPINELDALMERA